MVAYIEPGGRCVYHNEAFRRSFGLRSDAVEARALQVLLGEGGYGGAAERVKEVLSGRLVHHYCERAVNGHSARVYVHLVPHFDERGQVAGAYALVVDDERCRPHDRAPCNAAGVAHATALLQPADPAEGVQELYEGRSNDSAEWRRAVANLREALHHGQFRLFRQTIEDLRTGNTSFQGIFVRQAEEERNRLPPGAFFAVAEEFSLLGELDRWVISGVLSHEADRRRQNGCAPAMYCVHVSRDSIADPYFPDFVREALRSSGVPGEALCFEIQESHVDALRADSADTARELRRAGGQVMLGGFGRDKPSLNLLKAMPVNFVKIDGSLILDIARSDLALAKLRAIVQVAHGLGINTVADLAESPEVVAKLREIDVDYAQGIAVSAAAPLQHAAQSGSEAKASA